MSPSKILFYLCISYILLVAVVSPGIMQRMGKGDGIAQFNDTAKLVNLDGVIVVPPKVSNTTQKLKVKIDHTQSVVLVTTTAYPRYQYLDRVELRGNVKNPPTFEGFDYRQYLAKDGIYSVMDWPKVSAIGVGHQYNAWTFCYEKLLQLKKVLLGSIEHVFNPPGVYLLQGMVFGEDGSMPDHLKEQFNATGLSHISAVSGSNIVIVIDILMALLLLLGLWRQQALLGTIACIWLYIALIGLPVSGVRAALMGSSVLLAQIFGRQNQSGRVLVVTAAVLLLQNPLLLWYDVAFQLSFLASLAIIYIKPLIDKLPVMLGREKVPHRKEKTMLQKTGDFFFEILSTTVAAQLLTLPIIVYNFGQVSLIALVTNLLVLPIVPFLTIAGLIVAMVALVSHTLGIIVSLPCLAGIWYLQWVLEVFSKPWATIAINHVPWIVVGFCYTAIFAITRYLWSRAKDQFLEY